MENNTTMNCACVIHSNKYDWTYVQKLYNMLEKHSRREIKFHVFTEKERPVPAHMVKHCLEDWPGVSGPKKSWWYKIQLFNNTHISGPLLYMDLDVVLAQNIDWIWELDTQFFWAVHDFRRLWRPSWGGLNSSIMYWNTEKWGQIWENFKSKNIASTIKQFHGDQDFLNTQFTENQLCFFDNSLIKSWRWQLKDGGLNPKTRLYNKPGAGTLLDSNTAIMIFHGDPKPHEVHDTVIKTLWN